jgi:hypothetical protein
MKKLEIGLISILGIISVYFEFRNFKTDSLFFSWFNYLPITILIILTFFFIVKNIIWKKKILKDNLQIIIGTICIILVVFHAERIKSLENSELSFEARTDQIGNDGGLVLYFKKNGLLKAEKMDHWCVTYYWGNYIQKNDTIMIDIPIDFDLSKIAIFEGDSLLVFRNSVKFNIFK